MDVHDVVIDRLVGKQFGHLTLLNVSTERSDHGAFMANCRCKCGKIVQVPMSDLVNYRVLQCDNCKKTFSPVGMKFHHLTIIGTCDEWPSEDKVVLCRCDCNGPKSVFKCAFDSLTQTGKPKTCGCAQPARQGARLESLTGIRFGRLLVIDGPIYNRKGKRILCLCKCDCGNVSSHSLYELRNGEASSCGCLKIEKLVARSTLYESNLDKVLSTRYKTIYRRCYDKSQESYKDYGQKGITMCPEWSDTTIGKANFIKWAKESGFREGLTIERKDVHKGYSPDNCTWIPANEQAINRSITKYLTFCGITKYVSEWGRFLGHQPSYVYALIRNSGYNKAMKLMEDMVAKKLTVSNSQGE